MSSNLDIITNIHIYRLKRWRLVANIFSLVFMGIIFGVPLLMAVMPSDSLSTGFKYFSTPLTILCGFVLIWQILNTILAFFSYIKITSDGIEQKLPYKHIQCRWSDVDKLGKASLFFDVIYLKSFVVSRLSFSLKLFRSSQSFIFLSGYDGWSDGQLANDLKQYAPKLFGNESNPQIIRSENKDVISGTSQENRILAALSHVSVLFSSFGIIVPISIYLIQKNKSSYIGFQSLQASIWQAASFALMMVTSLCLMASMYIPFFISAITKSDNFLKPSNGEILLMMTVSILIMTLGNIVFIIYGIIGAIMTYQGKDFRYVFIANFLEKRNGLKSTKRA